MTAALFACSAAVLLVSLCRIAYVLPLLLVRQCRRRSTNAGPQPSACVVFPVFNEAPIIVGAVASMLRNSPPDVKIVVIDDGSTDGTSALLHSAFPEELRLQIVSMPHAGYASALQAGLDRCTADVMVIADADTLYPNGYVERGIAAFRDPAISGGRALMTVHNPSNTVLQAQEADYENISADMRAFDVFGALLVVSGPAGFWRAEALRQAGGFRDNVLSADLDATLAVLQHGGRLRLLSNVLVSTDAPATLPQLIRQRRRWNYGCYQVLWKRLRNGDFSCKTGLVMLHVGLYRALLHFFLPLTDLAAAWAVFVSVAAPSPVAASYLWLYGTWVTGEWLLICAERACQNTAFRTSTLRIPLYRLIMRMTYITVSPPAFIQWIRRKPIAW